MFFVSFSLNSNFFSSFSLLYTQHSIKTPIILTWYQRATVLWPSIINLSGDFTIVRFSGDSAAVKIALLITATSESLSSSLFSPHRPHGWKDLKTIYSSPQKSTESELSLDPTHHKQFWQANPCASHNFHPPSFGFSIFEPPFNSYNIPSEISLKDLSNSDEITSSELRRAATRS